MSEDVPPDFKAELDGHILGIDPHIRRIGEILKELPKKCEKIEVFIGELIVIIKETPHE